MQISTLNADRCGKVAVTLSVHWHFITVPSGQQHSYRQQEPDRSCCLLFTPAVVTMWCVFEPKEFNSQSVVHPHSVVVVTRSVYGSVWKIKGGVEAHLHCGAIAESLSLLALMGPCLWLFQKIEHDISLIKSGCISRTSVREMLIYIFLHFKIVWGKTKVELHQH